MKKLKAVRGSVLLTVVGGIIYGIIEVLWRGKTHWTMLLTGGMCFTALYKFYTKFSDMKTALKCVCGGAIITSAEFLCGMIVNVKLRLNVWDYSNCKFNIKGQICPLYSFFWVLLCLPVTGICRLVNKKSDRRKQSD